MNRRVKWKETGTPGDSFLEPSGLGHMVPKPAPVEQKGQGGDDGKEGEVK